MATARKTQEAALDETRRDSLLRRLQAIYVAEGYRRTTMSDLAARVRCSKRTLYQLAPSKEELFLIAVQCELDEIWRLGLMAEAETKSIQDRIHRYVTAAIVPCKRWSPAFLADVECMPEAHALLEQHLKDRMARVERMVKEGIRLGVFRHTNPKLVAEMIISSASRFCSPSFLEQTRIDLISAVESMCDLLWNGLLHPEDAVAENGRKARR
jgi:AcrR family transcriptional regulator